MYNENYKRTGKTKITIGDTKIVLTDEELINHTKGLIKKIDKKQIEWFLLDIDIYSRNYPSFKEFIDIYFVEEITFLRNEISKKGRS